MSVPFDFMKSFDEHMKKLEAESEDMNPAPLIAAIRSKEGAERLAKVEKIIRETPKALDCRSYRLFPKCATSVMKKNVNVKLITTPLLEAILEDAPDLVEILCKNGVNVNFNPRPNTTELNKEFSYWPLDLALHPSRIIMGKFVYLKPKIIKILCSYGATRSDGTQPSAIVMKELHALYEWLYNCLKQALQHAISKNKKLIIILPEIHSSKYSLLLETMIFTLAEKMGIKKHYMECSEAELQRKKEYGTWDTLFGGPLPRNPHSFLTVDYTLPISESLGIETIAVDRCPSRNEDQDESTIRSRNFVMAKTISALNDHGILVIGAKHLPGFMDPSLTYSRKPLFDKRKIFMLPINTRPLIKSDVLEQTSYTHHSSEIIKIADKINGEAELLTGEEILGMVRECDFTQRLNYISNAFIKKTASHCAMPAHVIQTIAEYDYVNLLPQYVLEKPETDIFQHWDYARTFFESSAK